MALGTAAGTTITSTATVEYTFAGDATPRSDVAGHSFDVQEIIDLVAVWQDAAPVPVGSPDAGRVLAFLVTNTGNGPEDLRLQFDAGLGGDDFDPAVQGLWLESNGAQGLQTAGASPDSPYAGGALPLAADESILVYVQSDIPGGLADTQTGAVQLTAVSTTPGAAGAPAGTTIANAGLNGVDAIVGTTQARAPVTGTYAVAEVAVALTKSVVRIVDPAGGSHPYPGARVTYRIEVAVTGSGNAAQLVVSDPLPADLSYSPGSLRVDGQARTDADDAPADNGDFNVTQAGAVTVNFGDIAAPATHTIEFTTIIN